MDYKRLHETAIAELKQYNDLAASDSAADIQKAATIRAVMQDLQEKERFALEQFYIKGEEGRRNGHVDNILSKYGISKTELYRLRDSALTNYCFAMIIAVLGGQKVTRST